MPEKLSDADIDTGLENLDGWTLVNGKLHRDYKFANFVEAFGFMTSAAIEAEKMNHNTEWFNVYSKVVVDLTTHEASGITALDLELAGKMEALAAGRG